MFVQFINAISVGGGGNGQSADNLLLPGQNRAGYGNDSKFVLFAVIGHARVTDGQQFRRQSCTDFGGYWGYKQQKIVHPRRVFVRAPA